MVIFHSYVSLPEGKRLSWRIPLHAVSTKKCRSLSTQLVHRGMRTAEGLSERHKWGVHHKKFLRGRNQAANLIVWHSPLPPVVFFESKAELFRKRTSVSFINLKPQRQPLTLW